MLFISAVVGLHLPFWSSKQRSMVWACIVEKPMAKKTVESTAMWWCKVRIRESVALQKWPPVKFEHTWHKTYRSLGRLKVTRPSKSFKTHPCSMGLDLFTIHEWLKCMVNWVVTFQFFVYFHRYLVKWSNLTNIFVMGWNHQRVNVW